MKEIDENSFKEYKKKDFLDISIRDKPSKLSQSNDIFLINEEDNKNLIHQESIILEKDRNSNEIKDLNFINFKESENIVCPECGEIPNLEINHNNFMIKSSCLNENLIEDSLINFIRRSNAKLNKDIELNECSECKIKMSELNNGKNDLNNKENNIDNEENSMNKSECELCSECKNKFNELNEEEEENNINNDENNINNSHSEICSKYKQKLKELNNKRSNMYFCKCNKYFCENCRLAHIAKGKENGKNEEEEDSEDDDETQEEKHELINISEKEFKCCIHGFEDYYYFCTQCKKNLCMECLANHPREHSIYDFSKEINKDLSEEQKQTKFEEQKIIINKFLKKLYDMRRKLDKRIEILDKTLQSYLEINNYILKKFNRKGMNYQTIENIKNINFNLPHLIDNFVNSTGEKESFIILISLFDYQNENNQNFKMKKDDQAPRKETIFNISKVLGKPLENEINENITSLCQLNNKLIVGDIKGKIHCFSLTKKEFKKKFTIPDNFGNDIKYLYSLKNGFFVSSIYNEFKIYEIPESETEVKYKEIQTFKYNNFQNIKKKENKNIFIQNNYHYQIMELVNGYLLYIDGDILFILTSDFKNHYHEKEVKKIELNSNIISMAELNTNKFCVYCENNSLITYDSNSFKEKQKIIFSKYQNFRKIIGVNTDIIAALGEKNIFLISEAKKGLIMESIYNEYKINDMCTDLNHIIVATPFYLSKYHIKLNSKGKYINTNEDIEIKYIINSLYLLNCENNNENFNNGRIVIVYNNKKIKVFYL